MERGLIIFFVVCLILFIVWLYYIIKALRDAIKNEDTLWTLLFIGTLILLLFGGLGVLVGIILLAVYYSTKAQRGRRAKEKKELRDMQLKSLKKGKVNVEIKGKMRKLK